MKHAPKFLGEGQYGCIHRPSLLCDPSVTMDYQNKVSKLLHKRHAEKELKEYELVQQSDKSFKYHLGTPETCAVGKVRTNMKPIGRCAAHSTILDNINHYSLLVMKNGGVDFIQFADKMKKEMSLKDNTTTMELFWIEVTRLLLGIRNFLKKNLVHHDLKGQNVVFDETSIRCNFIDFGLMEQISVAKALCQKSKYPWSFNHWSYPFECCLLDRDIFTEVKEASEEDRTKLYIQFLQDAKDDRWLQTFFRYTHILDDTQQTEWMQKFKTFLINDIDRISYETFLSRYFHTMDIYGLGLGLLYVLNTTRPILGDVFFTQMQDLCKQMVSAIPLDRIQIDELLIQYESVLSMTGITGKHNIMFQNHKQVPIPDSILLLEDEIAQLMQRISRQQKTMKKKEYSRLIQEHPMSNMRSKDDKRLSGTPKTRKTRAK